MKPSEVDDSFQVETWRWIETNDDRVSVEGCGYFSGGEPRYRAMHGDHPSVMGLGTTPKNAVRMLKAGIDVREDRTQDA